MNSAESPKLPDSRKVQIERAVDILAHLIEQGRVPVRPGEKILIDIVTELFEIGVGDDVVNRLMEKRAMRRLSVGEEAKSNFVSLPLVMPKLDEALEDMEVVRKVVRNVVDRQK